MHARALGRLVAFVSAAEEEIRGAARVSVDNTTDEKRNPSRNEARAFLWKQPAHQGSWDSKQETLLLNFATTRRMIRLVIFIMKHAIYI